MSADAELTKPAARVKNLHAHTTGDTHISYGIRTKNELLLLLLHYALTARPACIVSVVSVMRERNLLQRTRFALPVT